MRTRSPGRSPMHFPTAPDSASAPGTVAPHESLGAAGVAWFASSHARHVAQEPGWTCGASLRRDTVGGWRHPT